MRKWSLLLSILCLLTLSVRTAALPPLDFEIMYSAYVEVFDLNNNPVEGVNVCFRVDAWEGETGMPILRTTQGTTNANGYVALHCYINYYDYPHLTSMTAWAVDPTYSQVAAQGNYTTTSTTIYPDLWVMTGQDDQDENSFPDVWEQELAEKFCPTLYLHHTTQWIAPEPVEYLGVEKSDLWLYVYSNIGQYVFDLPITSENTFNPPLHEYHSWINSSNPNYSNVTGNAYAYAGQPPGCAYGTYYMRFHYNYAGSTNGPSGWINYYQTERVNNNYENTVYVHLFVEEPSSIIVQYWFFYPYNDAQNNHEGDWEHINVHIDSNNPDLADIVKIDYYFHKYVKTLPNASQTYSVVDQTHPKVYVGGNTYSINWPVVPEAGNHSGGSYPWTGIWYNCGALGLDEAVSGCGPTIPYSSINVVVLHEPEQIDFDLHPELCWLKVPIRWGCMEGPSTWDFIEPFANIWPIRKWVETDVGNDAVPGPRYHKGWLDTGIHSGIDAY